MSDWNEPWTRPDVGLEPLNMDERAKRAVAPPKQGDEIEADLEWLRGCTCELNGVTINPRFRETADKLSHALTAAEARGYERAKSEGQWKAIKEGEERGFLRCREEAAKVAERWGLPDEFLGPASVGRSIAAAIRSLKP